MDSDDDVAAKHWLRLLRDGTPRQQCLARTELGLIFERRGLLDEAVEAYEANVRGKVADPRPYERLAAIYGGRGDAIAEARIRMLTPKLGSSGRGAAPAHRPARPRPLLLVVLGALALAATGVVIVGAASLGLMALRSPPKSPEVDERLGIYGSATPNVEVSRPTRGPLISAQSSLPLHCSDAGTRFAEWRDPEGARLQAVAQFFREEGINPFRENPFVRRMNDGFDFPASEGVAAWIGLALYRKHRGEFWPTFPIYVRAQGVYRARTTVAGLVPPLRPVLSPEQWAEMQAWPPDDCDAILLGNPQNDELRRLMSYGVGDTNWMRSTPLN